MSEDQLDNIRKYRLLRSDPMYPFEGSHDTDEYISEKISQKKAELDSILPTLVNINPEQLQSVQDNVVKCINKLLELLTKQHHSYNLSKNQGTIIDNYIYGKVIGDLNSAMNSVYGFSYSDFYFEKDSDFDNSKLLEILKNMKNEFVSSAFTSYIDLEKLFYQHIEKIRELWIGENQGFTS